MVLDEVQQYIGADAEKAFQVQEVTETLSKHFHGKLLFVGTGQSAMRSRAFIGAKPIPIRVCCMSQTVRGVISRTKGEPVELVDIVVPDPGPGEAVVDITAGLYAVFLVLAWLGLQAWRQRSGYTRDPN